MEKWDPPMEICFRINPKQAAVLKRRRRKLVVARAHAFPEMRRKSAMPARKKMKACINAAAPMDCQRMEDQWLPSRPPRFFAAVLEEVKKEGSWLE